MNSSPPRVALITGASRGIGRQLALGCASRGISVAVNFISSTEAADAVVREIQKLGGTALAVQADCAEPAAVSTMVESVTAQLGRVDYLINNAGVGTHHPIEELREDHFDDVIRNNLRSAFLVTQAVVPHMRDSEFGRLIFMSSLAARTGGKLSAAYAASKGGMEGLMHYYATCLSRTGITANALAPALLATDMVDAMPHLHPRSLPIGRLGRAEELWPATQMLLECSYITGQTIHVNGGLYMT